MSLNTLPETIKAECPTSDKFKKSQLSQLLRQRNSDAQLALWQAMQSGNLTVREARAKTAATRSKKPGPKPYEHKFQPDDRRFTVRVTFRKSRVSHDDIREALRDTLRHLR